MSLFPSLFPTKIVYAFLIFVLILATRVSYTTFLGSSFLVTWHKVDVLAVKTHAYSRDQSDGGERSNTRLCPFTPGEKEATVPTDQEIGWKPESVDV
jgi:hypothetical protein